MITSEMVTGQNLRKIIFSVFAFCCLTACGVLKSDLTVQPGKQFELGGNRNGPFTVQLKNVGTVPVTISERNRDGQLATLGVAQPGVEQTVRFSSGSAALLRNTTTETARLFLTVSGDKDLSMTEKNNPQ